MDEINLRGEAGEEGGFFAGGVAAAYDTDRNIAIERAIAGGAGGESVADEFFLVRQIEPPRGSSAGDDERFGFDPLSVDFDPVVFVARLEFLECSELEPRAEFFGLCLHAHDEVGAVDALGEAGEIFHCGGGGELSAGLFALQHEGRERSAPGINGRGESGAAGADDDNFFHGWGD